VQLQYQNTYTISFLISMCVSEDPDRIINTMNMPWVKYQGIVQCLAGARGFSLPQC